MIYLYYHGGSANHGCEAIVRSTAKILNMPITLFSTNIDEEEKYGIDKIITVMEDKYIPVSKKSFKFIKSALDHKINKHDYLFVKYGHERFLNQIKPGDICMSIGGDNYCYSGVDKLGYYNRMIHEKGAKTVLWGCSVEPSVLNDKVIKDLKLYDLITVRESITYNALVEAGIKNNVVLCSDPAFQLDKACVELPYGFTSQNTVGINVSPLVIEMGNYVLENYIELVRYILEETELNILLVPHVVKEDSDDRKAIEKLKSYFSDSDRIAMTQDYNCEKIKGFISQCRMFIGARTHATIAAYSTCVPTLVAGYSVKAKGIAKDIFGSYENYVISVQNFSSENDLKDSFIWLCENEQKIRDYLKDKMPGYCGDSYIAEKELRRLTNND